MVLVLPFDFNFFACFGIIFSQERGIQLHGNLEVDEETRFSAVVRGVDDSGYDDCEDILVDSRNDETFTGTSVGKVVDGAEFSSRSSYMARVCSFRLIVSCINYSFVE